MSAERRIRPEINVTPLVDVVLVLLIICMVITPQMEGPSVNLAAAKNPDAEEKSRQMKDTVTLVLEADGDVFIGSDALSPESIPTRLGEEHRRRPDARVVIKADRAAPFGKVRALYSTCRRIGLTSVSLKVGDAVQGGT